MLSIELRENCKESILSHFEEGRVYYSPKGIISNKEIAFSLAFISWAERHGHLVNSETIDSLFVQFQS